MWKVWKGIIISKLGNLLYNGLEWTFADPLVTQRCFEEPWFFIFCVRAQKCTQTRQSAKAGLLTLHLCPAMITARIGRTFLLTLLPISLLCTLILVGHQNGAFRSRQVVHTAHKPSLNVTRENAAFVVLVRNSDLNEMRETMRQLEDRFNHRHGYPWIFMNDEPFDEKFKRYTSGIASGETFYETLNSTMWGYPAWIDQDKARAAREDMEQKQIIYGGSESYRHMCRYAQHSPCHYAPRHLMLWCTRFQSGFFFQHPRLDGYDYYW